MASQVCWETGTFYQTLRLTIIPDYLKGSYYANPLEDNPVVSTENKQSYPGQSGPVVYTIVVDRLSRILRVKHL